MNSSPSAPSPLSGDTVLVVDDDESICWVLEKALQRRGYRVALAHDAPEALALLERQPVSVVLLDIRMPGMSGLEAMQRIQSLQPETPIIVMTAQATMQNAIQAMKQGAYDYITKPFDPEAVERLVARALADRAQPSAPEPAPEGIMERLTIVGQCAKMQAIYKTIGRVAGKDVTVLLRGESGTGKELVARTIHLHSRRAAGPFVTVNSAAIPRELLESELFGHERGAFTGATTQKIGKFELARGGTIFLDEIGDMDLHLQTKLLRVLQEREFERVGGNTPLKADVRIIAATHQNLEDAVREKRFREDLYYRLNVFPIHLPPLRERMEDLPLLVRYFLETFAEELDCGPKRFSPKAMALMFQYHWPGNVRELENTVKRAMILSPTATIGPECLPEAIHRPAPPPAWEDLSLERFLEERLGGYLGHMKEMKGAGLYGMIMERVERVIIRMALRETGGNQVRAAQLLGINRNTLRKKMRELGIASR